MRVFKIMVGVMFYQCPARVMTQSSGVERGALWALRWITRRRRAALGHNNGYHALCPIFPPLTAFFWVVNISVTIFTAWRLPSVDVVAVGGVFKRGKSAL